MWCLVSDKSAIPLHVKKQVMTGKSDRKSTMFLSIAKLSIDIIHRQTSQQYKKLNLFTLEKNKETSVQLKTKKSHCLRSNNLSQWPTLPLSRHFT